MKQTKEPPKRRGSWNLLGGLGLPILVVHHVDHCLGTFPSFLEIDGILRASGAPTSTRGGGELMVGWIPMHITCPCPCTLSMCSPTHSTSPHLHHSHSLAIWVSTRPCCNVEMHACYPEGLVAMLKCMHAIHAMHAWPQILHNTMYPCPNACWHTW